MAKPVRLTAGELLDVLTGMERDTEIWIRLVKNGRFQMFPSQAVVLVHGVLSDGTAVIAVGANKP